MLVNYLKIAFRQLLKQKMYSAIKIGGFALGIAACLLIALYINNELSYDNYYQDVDRIYRVTGQVDIDGKTEKMYHWAAPMASLLRSDFPAVEKAGRLLESPLFENGYSSLVKREGSDVSIYEEGFAYADQDLLDIIHIPMVYGEASRALTEPLTIVLSRDKAEKYFPHINPVGKIIYLNDNLSKPYRIGGVMENFPPNSHLQYDFLLTLKNVEFDPGEQTNWLAHNYHTYVLVKPHTQLNAFNALMKGKILMDHTMNNMKKAGRTNLEIFKTAKMFLQPVTDLHLDGDYRFLWLFGAIAFCTLLLASINFINLSTAKSANRAKEVGLRKVVGSYRRNIIALFLTESTLFSICAFALAILIAWLLMPYFNALSDKTLLFPWTKWWLFPLLGLSSVVIGILAGAYPAFYLSAFKPAGVLKGSLSTGSKNSLLRSVLVVFQFTTSLILIIGTIVINGQMQYILNKKLGYNKDQVLLIQGTNTLGERVSSFKTELQKLSNVRSVSVSDYLPVDGTKRNGNSFWKKGAEPERFQGQFWVVDTGYFATFGISLSAGKNFTDGIANRGIPVIINQKFAEKIHLEQTVGQLITRNDGKEWFEIIGVVNDFHFNSLKNPIQPLCMMQGNSPSIISVKMNSADIPGTIAGVSSVWKTFMPQQAIRYTFLDESYAGMYVDVSRMGRIFNSFSVLAIIIACLGLFALSAFMAEQRRKEIGVRKVLGASVAGLITMLSGNFLGLIFISFCIASPIAWYFMQKWLQDFIYRIELQWWMFAFAGIIGTLIALFTISFQALRAAIANPVKSLRTE